MRQPPPPANTGPVDFFMAHQVAFSATLSARKGRPDLIDELLSRAFSSFEVNAAEQSQGDPEPACHKGCSTCCSLRVTATAPEVLMVARIIRLIAARTAETEFDLLKRIERADQSTCGLSEAERVALRRQCPYILEGSCVIYPVRPLACRAHLSFDKSACIEAAGGRIEQVPHSAAHMTVRSLIQNAMQSALRAAGLAWGSYELNRGMSIALGRADSEQAWLDGEDVFAEAAVSEISAAEMAATYDQIAALGRGA